ncbi:hypothetical protein [Metasolibacillus sp. FSL K6-0083]|uniref:hypothetical protein n=1 Tax=Metasolibacillus sp. FSL K6-0083 TaxID=2921416 RepID=UPI00079A9EB8|nr:hypothetical protein A0U40_16110 [[Bacillus] sp. KCTC 13219]
MNETAILDGITITAGYAIHGTQVHNMYGVGMYNSGNSPSLVDVIFSKNIAERKGGGIYNWNNSNSTITNVSITANKADLGGAILNDPATYSIL